MPSLMLLFHYYRPDDVVGARHMTELAEGLARRGWDVTASPCNRGCRDESRVYPAHEELDGVRVRRVWRPPLTQRTTLGRMLNATWMITAWGAASVARARPDVILIGAEPVMSVLVALVWRLFQPRTRIVHWCFDLYPEAAIADSLLRPGSLPVSLLTRLVRAAYHRCDLIADMGPCMSSKLERYRSPARTTTLTPWALVEPSEPLPVSRSERANLFGNASFGLLYSGNFGRAHSYEPVLALARHISDTSIAFAFSIRGNCESAVRSAVSPSDRNITIVPFAPEGDLADRLSAADVHIVTLKPGWTGTVVPSKFFGALAVGRPVLFCGDSESSIARWIHQHQVGWVLQSDSDIPRIASELKSLAGDPARRTDLNARCHRVYRDFFGREQILARWNTELRQLLVPRSSALADRFLATTNPPTPLPPTLPKRRTEQSPRDVDRKSTRLNSS